MKKPGLNKVLLSLLIYQQRPFFRQLASERDHENLANVVSTWALHCSRECTAPWPGLSAPPRHADGVVQQIQLGLVGTSRPAPAWQVSAGVRGLEPGKHGMMSIPSASPGDLIAAPGQEACSWSRLIPFYDVCLQFDS